MATAVCIQRSSIMATAVCIQRSSTNARDVMKTHV